MKVAVLGASGHAGSEITKELSARGHEVVAIARRPKAIPNGTGITAVAGDASDPATLASLIRGCDAVISALHFNIGTDVLLAGLKEAGVPRLLVTGGGATLEIAPGKRVIDQPDFPADWKDMAMQGVAFLDSLHEEKDIDWTFFSPAALLIEGPRLGHYRLGGDNLVVNDAGESENQFRRLCHCHGR